MADLDEVSRRCVLRRRLRHRDGRCLDHLGYHLRHWTCITTGCSQQIAFRISGDVHYVQTRSKRYAQPGAPRKRFLMKCVLQSRKRLGSRVPGFGETASLRDIAALTCAGFLVMQVSPSPSQELRPRTWRLALPCRPWAVLMQTGAAILDCYRVSLQVPRDRFDERYERTID